MITPSRRCDVSGHGPERTHARCADTYMTWCGLRADDVPLSGRTDGATCQNCRTRILADARGREAMAERGRQIAVSR